MEEWAEEERRVACLNGTVDGVLLTMSESVESPNDTEVKGVVLRYAADGDPEGGRIGRVRFWERQHELLQERDGRYLVVVYSTEEPEPVLHDRFVHWSSLDEIMEEHGYAWYEASEHRMRSRQTQIPWSRFFPDVYSR